MQFLKTKIKSIDNEKFIFKSTYIRLNYNSVKLLVAKF
jgi:hypothetical protein